MTGGPLTLAHCRSLSCAAPFDLALRTTSAQNKSVNNQIGPDQERFLRFYEKEILTNVGAR